MRTRGRGFTDVQHEFDEGGFVRTHILRPTWHFVAAEDIRWILALTSPRVQLLNRSRYRQLGLGQADLDRGSELIVAAVSQGNVRTRRELGAVLEGGGISSAGQRLAYLVMNAELEGLICSGPMRGAQHTYAALDERVASAAKPAADQSLGELTWRFFAGHGPASVKDFTRWSSLTTSDADAGLQLASDRLDRVVVDDEPLWFDPSLGQAPAGGRAALLLPLYDEVILSYRKLNFPVAAGHPQPPGMDRFVGWVLVDGVNVGTWRRTVRGSKVLVESRLTPQLDAARRKAVSEAEIRLADFLEKDLEVVPSG
jgi:hypothetical protein